MKRAESIRSIGEKKLYCNCCGKQLKMENGIMLEDAFQANKEWGYFSDYDTQVHQFNLCEECYNKMIQQFKIPVEVKDKLELL